MDKLYIVIKVGRQVAGEFIFVVTEKCFKERGQAEAYMKSQAQHWQETIQNINCFCERAIHEVEVE